MPRFDIFIAHSRDDSSFARSLGKALESLNISVSYGKTLYSSSLTEQIKDGFTESFFGIVITSKNFIKEQQNGKELSFLLNALNSKTQLLHPIWYNIEELEMLNWDKELAQCVALHSPPESSMSIARKLEIKLAGSIELQQKVLLGSHPVIQYIPPKLGTFRNPGQENPFSDVISNIKNYNSMDQDQCDLNTTTEDVEVKNENYENRCIKNFTISEEIIKKISKYFSHNLKGLSNWKDLAKYYNISIKHMISLNQSEEPCFHLLSYLFSRDLRINDFFHLCNELHREDVVKEIQRCLHNESVQQIDDQIYNYNNNH